LQGALSSPVASGSTPSTLYFRGKFILDAVINDLKNTKGMYSHFYRCYTTPHSNILLLARWWSLDRDAPLPRWSLDRVAAGAAGMSAATDVIVTGGSAGGLAAFIHADKWAQAFPAARVIAMPEAGVFVDNNARSYTTNMRWAFTAMNSVQGTSAAVDRDVAESRCDSSTRCRRCCCRCGRGLRGVLRNHGRPVALHVRRLQRAVHLDAAVRAATQVRLVAGH
jgi:hypothetical protein